MTGKLDLTGVQMLLKAARVIDSMPQPPTPPRRSTMVGRLGYDDNDDDHVLMGGKPLWWWRSTNKENIDPGKCLIS